MRRTLLGWLLIVHALAHAFVGMWAAGHGSIWPATLVWSLAAGAYLFAALGLLGAFPFRHWWKPAVVVGTISSFVLVVYYLPFWGAPGIIIDVAVFIATLDVFDLQIDRDLTVVESRPAAVARHPIFIGAARVVGTVCVLYAAVAMLTRPMLLRWGSTADERQMALPGDDVQSANDAYRIDHAITIHAPATAVWPWLVKLRQDRAGFNSHDWLERVIGDEVHNAGRIDSVFEPNRVIGLERWSTVVVRPIDSSTTRLIVRTRAPLRPTSSAFLLAPLEVYVLEPAHFIMERAMLRGIRDRAERSVATSTAQSGANIVR